MFLALSAHATHTSYRSVKKIQDLLEDEGFTHISVQLLPVDAACGRLTLEEVLGVACAAFGEEEHRVRSRLRRRETTITRHAYCALAKRYTGFSLENIGRLIGRDHATVVYATKLVDTLLEVNDMQLAPQYREAEQKLLRLKQEKQNQQHL